MTELYDAAFYAARRPLLHEYAAMANTLVGMFKVESCVDFGCGPGEIIRAMACRGVSVFGIDGSDDADAAGVMLTGRVVGMVKADLRQPLTWNNYRRDLVLCLETAEHIEAEYADQLVENVTQAVGRWLVWSAATPGQGGTGHVNEQPTEYWRAKIEAKGLRYAEGFSAVLRSLFAADAPQQPWYGSTTMIFERL